jgi:hypothetical protein
MFTIKIVEPSGLELIKQVKAVMFMPDSKSQLGKDCVTYFETGDEPKAPDIYEGDIYVMNENGNTVADYHLDKSVLLYGRS